MPDAVIDTVRALRRHQILEAARAIVAADGLESLTFAELEGRLAFTRGVITYHFANKDEVVHALLEDALARIDRGAADAVRAAGDPEEAVVSAVRAMVHGFLVHRDAAFVLVSFWGRLRSDPRARDANARLYRAYRDRATALVREGQAAGRFRADADAEAAGAVMVGAVIGVTTQVLFEDGAVDVEAAIDTAGRSLASWLAP